MARDDELWDDERPMGPSGSDGTDPFALPGECGEWTSNTPGPICRWPSAKRS